MNKYEKRAQAERKAVVRSSINIGGGGLALIVVVVLIFWLNSSAPAGYLQKIVIGLAVLLLIWRMVGRRMKTGASKAAQPDPESRIKLD